MEHHGQTRPLFRRRPEDIVRFRSKMDPGLRRDDGKTNDVQRAAGLPTGETQ
jgi:hypothetical protein